MLTQIVGAPSCPQYISILAKCFQLANEPLGPARDRKRLSGARLPVREHGGVVTVKYIGDRSLADFGEYIFLHSTTLKRD